MKLSLSILVLLATCNLHLPTANAATVTGNLKDLTLQPLDTKITFTPTNDVLLTTSGLSGGPPITISSVNGQFSTALEAGDYTVSLPLIATRRSFRISVMDSNGSVDITNLLTAPLTYTYTNNLNYAVKSVADDAAPGFLADKINVAGALTRTLVTNSGAVTLLLTGAGGSSAPLHVNLATLISWSTNGEGTLLDGVPTISAGSLAIGSVIAIEGFGSFDDPLGNSPTATLKLKLGATTVLTESQIIATAGWHLRALLTVRSIGVTGTVVGAMQIIEDNLGLGGFSALTQTATVNTTGSLAIDLTASIDDFTGAEKVSCHQLLITIQ
jgi:hypothetical protein